MIKTERYLREENHVLRKENSETNFTVRLHFEEDYGDEKIMEELQEILFETYIRNFIPKGGG